MGSVIDIAPYRSPEMLGETTETQGLLALCAESSRDERLIPSDLDRYMVADIATSLVESHAAGFLNESTYADVLNALLRLVPREHDGQRWIGDRRLTSRIEERIRSRADAPEHDALGSDGVWASVPPLIRQKIIEHGRGTFAIEMTAGCTVGCSFCAVAPDKGPVTAKFSIESLCDMVEQFWLTWPGPSNSPAQDYGHSSTLYWGTDPFDARWRRPGGELDYTDVIERLRKRGVNRNIFHSTAVPIGAELSVMRFAIKVLTAELCSHEYLETLRISRTTANSKRVDDMCQVLEGIFGPLSGFERLVVTDNRDENVAVRGVPWRNNTEPTLFDITGPNCKDTVIISPAGLRSIVTLGASQDHPTGEVMEPTYRPLADGGSVFVIPELTYINYRYGTSNPGGICPDPQVNTYRTSAGGEVVSHARLEHSSPSRRLLRVVSVIMRACYEMSLDEPSGLSPDAKLQLGAQLAEDIAVLRREHVLNNASNVSIAAVLKMCDETDIAPSE